MKSGLKRMLNSTQLNTLINELKDHIEREIVFRNEEGTLPSFLSDVGFHRGPQDLRKNKKAQKILIVGDTKIKETSIIGIFKEAGISKDRIELITDYGKIGRHDFNKYQYNDKYAVIMVGPTPHSGVNMSKFSSIVVRLEKERGFPHIVRLSANKKFKVTNSNLSNTLDELIAAGIIIQDL